jgi:hypothetical protein
MSSYTGSVIRTTHMTGIVTDVGLITGRPDVARDGSSERCVLFNGNKIEENLKKKLYIIKPY